MRAKVRRTALGIGIPALAAAGLAFGLTGCAARSAGATSAQGPVQAAAPSNSAGTISLPSGSGGQGSNGQGADGTATNLVTATPPGAQLPTPTMPASSASAAQNPVVIFTLPATLHLPIVDLTPGPSGVIGDPKVPCLEGYVWRQAYSGDYVCVTPAQRTQAQQDNAAAASRRSPDGGAYGSQTCVQGYVWRQVVTNDDVCVTPAERSQVQADNAAAGRRIAYLSLWVTDWYPPAPAPSCDGSVCTSSGDGGGPQVQVNGDAFNDGLVLLEIRSDSGAVLWSQLVLSQKSGSLPGYVVAGQSDKLDCSADPAAKSTSYAVAYDYTSGRWSSELPLKTDCANF